MLNSEKLKEETVKKSPIDPYTGGEEEEEELNKWPNVKNFDEFRRCTDVGYWRRAEKMILEKFLFFKNELRHYTE